MQFKKMIILLSVTVSIMFGVLLGISYGWYTYSNAESNIKGSTVDEVPTVLFAQNEYISTTNIMPIYDEDRYRYGIKNSFTITLGENLQKYQTGIEIMLSDINISEELKIKNYKYELIQNKQTITTGSFENLEKSTTIKLMPMTVMTPIEYPYTYTYEVLIWLSEDDTDQNYLMNKTFGAKIKVNSAIKKQ